MPINLTSTAVGLWICITQQQISRITERHERNILNSKGSLHKSMTRPPRSYVDSRKPLRVLMLRMSRWQRRDFVSFTFKAKLLKLFMLQPTWDHYAKNESLQSFHSPLKPEQSKQRKHIQHTVHDNLKHYVGLRRVRFLCDGTFYMNKMLCIEMLVIQWMHCDESGALFQFSAFM